MLKAVVLALLLASSPEQELRPPRNFIESIKLPSARQDDDTRAVVAELKVAAVSTAADAERGVMGWLAGNRLLGADFVMRATGLYRLPDSAGAQVGQLAWSVAINPGAPEARVLQIVAISRLVCWLNVDGRGEPLTSSGCRR